MRLAPFLLLAAALAGCAPYREARPALIAPSTAPEWSQEGADAARLSRTGVPTPDSWETARISRPLVEPFGENPIGEYASPLVLGEVIVAASSTRKVEAFSWKDLGTIWSCAVPGRVMGSPAYGDGRLYVADDEGNVTALDLEGRPLWSFHDVYPFVASPVFADGKLFVLTGNRQVYCLEASDGAPVWKFGKTLSARDRIWRGSGLAAAGGRVFLGMDDGTVTALEASAGKLLWKTKIAMGALFQEVVAGPAVDGDVVYAGTREGPLTALEVATGAVLWTRPVKAVGIAVGEDRLYFGTPDGTLAAVRKADGEPLWTAALDGGVPTAPVLADGEVAVGASDGGVSVFDAETGALKKRYRPGTGVSSRPYVGEKGLAFLSNGGVLHRIDRR